VAVVNLGAFRAMGSQLTQSRFPRTRTTVKKVSNDQPTKLLGLDEAWHSPSPMRNAYRTVPFLLFVRHKFADVGEQIILHGIGKDHRLPSPDRPGNG